MDRSGPTVKTTLIEQGVECKFLFVVPDDEAKIRETVKGWCDEGSVDLVITTGGTGFGVRDRTPEVCAHTSSLCVS